MSCEGPFPVWVLLHFNSRTLSDALDQLMSQALLVSVSVAVTESNLGQGKDLVHLTGRSASRRGRQGRGYRRKLEAETGGTLLPGLISDSPGWLPGLLSDARGGIPHVTQAHSLDLGLPLLPSSQEDAPQIRPRAFLQ